MGNTLGGKKTAKVMTINGEMIKFKTPINVGDIVKDYPGYVLLESEAVKHYGIRAKPMEPMQELKPKRLYFLVMLPEDKGPRRVRSGGIHMSAKDRLESLMLAKRSASDLSIVNRSSQSSIGGLGEAGRSLENGAMRLKMKLPKAQVEKLMMESKDGGEIAEKIVNLYMINNGGEPNKVQHGPLLLNNNNGFVKNGLKSREKRVEFLAVGREIQLAV